MKVVFESQDGNYDFTVEEHGSNTIVLNSIENTDPYYLFSIVLTKEEAMLLVKYITDICK